MKSLNTFKCLFEKHVKSLGETDSTIHMKHTWTLDCYDLRSSCGMGLYQNCS